MSECPLVFIEWEDSAQPIPGWQHLSQFTPKPVVKCTSVGWLIHDGDDSKTLAPNMGGLESENNVQVSGVIRIPARCVIRVVELDEPALNNHVAPSFHPVTGQTQQELSRLLSLDVSCRTK